jgi:hypothetical protein
MSDLNLEIGDSIFPQKVSNSYQLAKFTVPIRPTAAAGKLQEEENIFCAPNAGAFRIRLPPSEPPVFTSC